MESATFCRARALARLLFLTFFAFVAGPSIARAEPTQAIAAKVQGDETAGYARLVFRFERMPGASARLSNNIVVISFTEPVTVPLDRLTGAVADYVAAARVDPDGKAVR